MFDISVGLFGWIHQHLHVDVALTISRPSIEARQERLRTTHVDVLRDACATTIDSREGDTGHVSTLFCRRRSCLTTRMNVRAAIDHITCHRRRSSQKIVSHLEHAPIAGGRTEISVDRPGRFGCREVVRCKQRLSGESGPLRSQARALLIRS